MPNSDVKNTDTLVVRIKPEIDITEKKYPEIYLDEDFSIYIKIFRIILMFPYPKMFHEISRSALKFYKDDSKDFLDRTKKIIEIIGNDTQLSSELGIDIEYIANVYHEKNEEYQTEKKSRARQETAIKLYHGGIIKKLHSLGWGQTKQIQFIYDLYYECDYERCRTANEHKPKVIQQEQERFIKDRIRKSQEESIKNLDKIRENYKIDTSSLPFKL